MEKGAVYQSSTSLPFWFLCRNCPFSGCGLQCCFSCKTAIEGSTYRFVHNNKASVGVDIITLTWHNAFVKFRKQAISLSSLMCMLYTIQFTWLYRSYPLTRIKDLFISKNIQKACFQMSQQFKKQPMV